MSMGTTIGLVLLGAFLSWIGIILQADIRRREEKRNNDRQVSEQKRKDLIHKLEMVLLECAEVRRELQRSIVEDNQARKLPRQRILDKLNALQMVYCPELSEDGWLQLRAAVNVYLVLVTEIQKDLHREVSLPGFHLPFFSIL